MGWILRLQLFGKSRVFPLNPPKVKLFAEGSTATKLSVPFLDGLKPKGKPPAVGPMAGAEFRRERGLRELPAVRGVPGVQAGGPKSMETSLPPARCQLSHPTFLVGRVPL